MLSNIEDRIIFFYDGNCGFCSKIVLLIWKYSKNKDLYFAPLQGITAKGLRDIGYKLDENLTEVNLLLETSVYRGPKAFYKICKISGQPLILLAIFQFLPYRIKNLIYNLIARNRQFLGSKSSCEIPSKNLMKRLLP